MSAANLFSWFQLDIVNTFTIYKKFKLGYHAVSSKSIHKFIFWKKSMGIIESGKGGTASSFQTSTLSLYIKINLKDSWNDFFFKYNILLNISSWISFPSSFFYWEKSKTRIIFIQHDWAVNKKRKIMFILINCTCTTPLYYV